MAKPDPSKKDGEGGGALAVQTSTDLDFSSLAEYSGAGLENISANDLVLPRLAILQSTSPVVQDENADNKAGELYNLTTGENYGRSINFVTLAYWPSRTKWETADINSPVECISPDAVKGTKYGACGSCRFAQWTNEEGGKGVAPECTDFKNLLMLPLVEGATISSSFMVYGAKRTALKALNRFLTAVKMLKTRDGQGNEVTPPIFATIWKLETKQQTNLAKGAKYYTPEFTRMGFVTSDMIPGLIQRFNEFKKMQDEVKRVAAQQNSSTNEEGHDYEGDAPHEGDASFEELNSKI